MSSSIAESPSAQPGPPNHPKLIDVWFDDGNIIVVAGDRRFCVYVGILSEVSSVFRDMFQISKSAQQDHVDGRPVVHLAGDSPEDISFLLKSVHDIDFFLPPPARVSFAVTAGILRTSTKYDIPTLRNRALLHLANAYPTSLPEWGPSINFLEPSEGDHFGAVKLAREFDLEWIRPAAMYSCMSLPLSQTYSILEGGKLSDQDRRLCTLAIQPLKFTQLECFKFLMDSWECSKTFRCNSKKRTMFVDMMRDENSDFLSKAIEKTDDLCPSCFERVRSSFLRNRAEGWKKIPSICRCRLGFSAFLQQAGRALYLFVLGNL